LFSSLLPLLQSEYQTHIGQPLDTEARVFQPKHAKEQSRSQSPQTSWSAGGCRERFWGTGIFTAEIVWLPIFSFVTVNSQFKKINFFRVPPGDHPLTKTPEDSGSGD